MIGALGIWAHNVIGAGESGVVFCVFIYHIFQLHVAGLSLVFGDTDDVFVC